MLWAAVVSGLIAGGAAAVFHSRFTEPVIERAIETEERLAQARGEAAKAPLVDRRTQRWGLVLGFLLYGTAWGLLFGLVFQTMEPRLPPWSPVKRGFLLALLAGWSVAIFPFIKYPANPPGAGDPETVWYRQALYLGFLGLSAAGTAMAGWLWARRRRAAAVLLYVGFLTAAFLAMPSNPDPVMVSAQLIWTFRGLSLAGLVLFWGVLGMAFGWLTRERLRHLETWR